MLALIPRLLPGLIATTNTKQHRSTTKQPVRSFRFEMLEAREVLSHTHMAPADPPATESESEAQSTAFAEQIAAAMNASLQAQAQLRAPMPVVIDEVQLNATGDEIAIQGSLAGRSFETTTTITGLFTPSSDPGVCGILNLELGPIHLDILGLNLDTSEICLNITAQEGSGNLLGNLLCEVADLLSGPTSLSDLLSGGLIPADQLQQGVGEVLQTSLGDLLTSIPTASQPTDAGAPGVCPILDLSLGPVHLDLLGLIVDLDNCEGGPVTVSLTAIEGPGNLLGNLLCGVTHLLDGDDITSLLNISSATLLGNNLISLSGDIAGQSFRRVTSLTGVFQPPADGEECGILSLQLGEIHLDLLGLKVDTSEICLDISAISGGGLLGDLLCNITQALDAPASLHNLIRGPASPLRDDARQFAAELDTLLDSVFEEILNQGTPTAGSDAGFNFDQEGDCQILDVALGPVDLTLLGLNVHLDDCNDGPVLLSISAEEGPGNLLGNLLCAVTGLLDEPVVTPDLALPIEIDRVRIRGDNIELRGTIGGERFRVSTTFTGLFTPSETAGVCGILSLELAPIHLDVLGLTLDTSEICLNITAQEGSGNLLGNLLCDVAGALDGPLSLNELLQSGLAPLGQLRNALQDTIATSLESLLQSVPNLVSLPGAGAGDEHCPIVNLSLGPLNLDLLGLLVELDDCNDGPVIVNVAAVPGAGNLLGNLLCSIVGLLDRTPGEVSDELESLIDIQDLQELPNDFVRFAGTLAGEAVDFTTRLVGTFQPPAPGEDCGILSLELGEIHLDLLGLNLDTSEICLDISAVPGDNNLLGNLLCEITGALDSPISLSDLLSGVVPALQDQARDLFNELAGLLSSVLGQVLVQGDLQTAATGAIADGDVCPILDLSLGPIDLNVLGLNIHLDDCNDGPVTVSLTAEEGPGNLLGNLLCSITGLLDAASRNIIAFGVDAGQEPLVRVLDADTGEELYNFLAYNAAFLGGVRVAVGDVNGDGTDDIITAAGTGGGPHIRVFNGLDGTPLTGFFAYNPAFTGGVYVAVGDLNGDNKADIVTGAGAGGGPHVRAFSGEDGSVLGDFFAYNPLFGGGVTVAVGDVDGDGAADIVTGAGPGGGPHVRVFNLDGSPISGLFAYNPMFSGGVFVSAADVDGDDKAEIITGAGAGGGPHVRVFTFDGTTFPVVTEFFAFDPFYQGGVRVAATLNEDGLANVIATTGSGIPSVIREFDGRTGALLSETDPIGSGTPGGFISGNLTQDLILGLALAELESDSSLNRKRQLNALEADAYYAETA